MQKLLYLLAWIGFLFAVIFLDWERARLHHLAAGLLAPLGSLVAIGWFFGKVNALSFRLGISVIAIAVYFAWWCTEIFERFSLDPGPGFLKTLEIQFAIPSLLLSKRIADSDYSIGGWEIYFTIGMPMFQMAFVILFISGAMKAKRGSN